MDKLIKKLEENKALQTTEQVQEFEKALTELSKTSHPELLEDLFLLFHDDAKFDESLWGLLHYVESLNQELQVDAFFRSFVRLSKNGKEWIETILFRMMNNEKLLNLLIKKSPSIKKPDIEKYKKVLLEIGNDPKFKNKVDLIIKKMK